jgi:hypothetical protein
MVSGNIWIDSPLPPAAVLENLRARGREWRESAVPEDLRKFKVQTLGVEITGSQFQMHWLGNISPFYNPLCYGTVEQAGNGSRITAGFKLAPREVLLIVALASMALLPMLLGSTSSIQWLLSVFMLACLAWAALKNRTSEPMRARLIEVLTNAAGQSTSANDSLSTASVRVRQQILL